MAALIGCSNVYLTKPGGASTSEGLALGTYLYFDQETAGATPWEPVNMNKVTSLKAGEPIDKTTFSDRIQVLLSRKTHNNFEFPGRHFNENILKLAKELTGSCVVTPPSQ